jgi:hypothetical protein
VAPAPLGLTNLPPDSQEDLPAFPSSVRIRTQAYPIGRPSRHVRSGKCDCRIRQSFCRIRQVDMIMGLAEGSRT